MNGQSNKFKFAPPASSVQMPSADTKQSIELALSGDCEAFRDFLILYPDMVNAKEPIHGNVPLHVAASKNNVGLIELLVKYGANVNIQDIWGNTALHYAIDKEKKEAVETLIKHGINVNLSDYKGNSPLHSACRIGNLSIVKVLLRNGADPDAFDFSNMKPLQRCKKYDVVEAIEMEINRRQNRDANAQQVINWLSMGIGLGIGIGMAFSKQQQNAEELKRIEIEKINSETMQYTADTRKNRHAELRHQGLATIQSYLGKK